LLLLWLDLFQITLNLHSLVEQIVKAGQASVLVGLQGLLHCLLINVVHLILRHFGEHFLALGFGVYSDAGALLALSCVGVFVFEPSV